MFSLEFSKNLLVHLKVESTVHTGATPSDLIFPVHTTLENGMVVLSIEQGEGRGGWYRGKQNPFILLSKAKEKMESSLVHCYQYHVSD